MNGGRSFDGFTALIATTALGLALWSAYLLL